MAKFIFITGAEGSGTTALLQMMGEMEDSLSIGGNYCNKGYGELRGRFNQLTAELWQFNPPVSDARKKSLITEIKRTLNTVPAQNIIYKRSYPFRSRNFYPVLSDIELISEQRKIIVLRRDLERNAKSIFRRGFVSGMDEAMERSIEGNAIISKQLRELDPDAYLEIRYEDLVHADKKIDILTSLETYLEISRSALTNLHNMITGPTAEK